MSAFSEIVEASRIALEQNGLQCEAAARAYLKQAAEETIFYVALGNAMKKEFAAKHNLTERQAEGLISKAAVRLVDQIRAL